MDKGVVQGLKAKVREISSRTTITITSKGIEALEWLEKRFGLTVSEVLDLYFSSDINESNSRISLISEQLRENEFPITIRDQRKGIGISRGVLEKLNSICKNSKFSRDALIESILLDAKDNLEQDIEDKRQQNRKALLILDDIIDYVKSKRKELLGIWGSENELYHLSHDLIAEVEDLKRDTVVATDPEDSGLGVKRVRFWLKK
jgi:hypothetical protein